MSGLFSKPKVPKPPPAPPVVTVNEARKTVERNDALLRRRGYLSTVLDGQTPPSSILGGK